MRPCPKCDYDLTGLPDVYTCPECGFASDLHTVVFHVGQPAGVISSIFLVGGFAAAVVSAFLGARTVGPLVAFSFGIVWLILYVGAIRAPKGQLIVNHVGVHVFLPAGPPVSLAWADVREVNASWGNAALHIIPHHGRKVTVFPIDLSRAGFPRLPLDEIRRLQALYASPEWRRAKLIQNDSGSTGSTQRETQSNGLIASPVASFGKK